VLRLLLAVVFVVAAVAKLFDQRGTRKAVVAFGAPARLATVAAVLVPIDELVVAVLLLVPATAWVGAIGALVLLAAFSVAIAGSLGRGRAPECHCFGQLRGGPVSSKTLVRNALLAVPAFLLVLLG